MSTAAFVLGTGCGLTKHVQWDTLWQLKLWKERELSKTSSTIKKSIFFYLIRMQGMRWEEFLTAESNKRKWISLSSIQHIERTTSNISCWNCHSWSGNLSTASSSFYSSWCTCTTWFADLRSDDLLWLLCALLLKPGSLFHHAQQQYVWLFEPLLKPGSLSHHAQCGYASTWCFVVQCRIGPVVPKRGVPICQKYQSGLYPLANCKKQQPQRIFVAT